VDDQQFNQLNAQLQKLQSDSDEQRELLKEIEKGLRDLSEGASKWGKDAKQSLDRGSY
jgi:phage shock protein A